MEWVLYAAEEPECLHYAFSITSDIAAVMLQTCTSTLLV